MCAYDIGQKFLNTSELLAKQINGETLIVSTIREIMYNTKQHNCHFLR